MIHSHYVDNALSCMNYINIWAIRHDTFLDLTGFYQMKRINELVWER